jgi:hypothetical protein
MVVPSLFFFFNTNKVDGDKENKGSLEFNEKRPFEMFDTYYKNNFAFRNLLSNQYLAFNSNFIKTSPIADKVLFGKDGWYFLGDSYNKVYSKSLGINTTTEIEIDSTVTRVLEMKRFCDSLNIKFYYFVPPNSHTICSEYLPVKPNFKNKRDLDKIIAKLSGKVTLIDVRNELFAEKKKQKIYYKTDSHWNNAGGFIGTKKLIATIKKDFPLVTNLNRTDFYLKEIINEQMDLTTMLNEKVIEKDYLYKLKEKIKYKVTHDTINKVAYMTVENSKKPYNCLLFRDSYAGCMVPFIDPSFGKTTYISSPIFDKNKVIKEKPDFVIFEIVERNVLFSGKSLLQ